MPTWMLASPRIGGLARTLILRDAVLLRGTPPDSLALGLWRAACWSRDFGIDTVARIGSGQHRLVHQLWACALTVHSGFRSGLGIASPPVSAPLKDSTLLPGISSIDSTHEREHCRFAVVAVLSADTIRARVPFGLSAGSAVSETHPRSRTCSGISPSHGGCKGLIFRAGAAFSALRTLGEIDRTDYQRCNPWPERMP